MKDRLWILLWIPALYIIYLAELLPILLMVVIILGFYEITKRKTITWWKPIAVIHMAGLYFLVLLSAEEIIFVSLVVIANDTTAYFGGKYFNFLELMKRKIFPVTSPKKTVGGFIYGVFFGTLTGWFLADQLGLPHSYNYLAIAVCLLAVAGDFAESKFKRHCKIKDSGEGLFTEKLMKGHGGVYDRFDAVSLAAPGVIVLKGLFF